MARITVEDCLKHNNNRFDLILAASARARQLAYGADTQLSWEHDKPTVMALREIADDLIDEDGNPIDQTIQQGNSQADDAES